MDKPLITLFTLRTEIVYSLFTNQCNKDEYMNIKQWLITCIGFLLLSFQAVAAESEDYQTALSDFEKPAATSEFFKNAYGYALFPSIGKGGIGIGGAHGNGQVYQDGAVTGTVSMTQVTIGLQLGGQVFSQIIFFEDKTTYDSFTSGSFEFGAQASAVALTAGASAQAGSTGTGAGAGETKGTAGYVNGFAIFTLAGGGLMYEASIGGQKFSFEGK